MQGRGKKTNYDKNARAAEDFAKGKRIGRPKQVFIPATEPTMEMVLFGYNGGHWEKVR